MSFFVLTWLLNNLWPTCPAEGWVTSEYGYRIHPITHKRTFHTGIDIGNKEGTFILAPWGAHIQKVRRNHDFGLHVIMIAGDMKFLMAHLSEVKVKEGQWVSKGTLIGLMGHTGRATGDHLHIETWHKHKRINPQFVLTICRQ